MGPTDATTASAGAGAGGDEAGAELGGLGLGSTLQPVPEERTSTGSFEPEGTGFTGASASVTASVEEASTVSPPLLAPGHDMSGAGAAEAGGAFGAGVTAEQALTGFPDNGHADQPPFPPPPLYLWRAGHGRNVGSPASPSRRASAIRLFERGRSGSNGHDEPHAGLRAPNYSTGYTGRRRGGSRGSSRGSRCNGSEGPRWGASRPGRTPALTGFFATATAE